MRAANQRMYVHTATESGLWPPPDRATSAYEQLAPPPVLARHVASIHMGYERIPPGRPIEERVLPDGSVRLLFNLGEPPAVIGGVARATEALGAKCEPEVIRMAGALDQMGVQLRAGGVAALLGVPAGELAGGSASLEDLWGGGAAEALERLATAGDGTRVAALEQILLERLRRSDGRPHAGAAEAMRLIAGHGGRMRVRDLAAMLGVGERRLAQIFHHHVGLTPKAACRLARFRAAVSLLRREPARSWSWIAHQCGFADQPHLVHEFRAIAGLTPRELVARAGFGFLQDSSRAPR